jgi:hypothetical protein
MLFISVQFGTRFIGYDILILNAGNDSERITAAATDLDVETAHTF